MRTGLSLALVASLAVLAGRPDPARAQKGDALVLALYAPSIPFKDTASRLAYLKLLADAIGGNIGRRVEPRLYNNLAQLKSASPDFAIVEPQCAGGSWRPIATAKIDKRLSRPWSFYVSGDETMSSLKGKKIAFAAAGCDDRKFIENVLFRSEVRLRYFKSSTGKPTVSGAVAEVATVHAAQAVFAPTANRAGVKKLFDAGEVPNPVLVVVNGQLDRKLVDQVQDSAQKFGSSAAVDGWGPVDRQAQSDLSRRMRGASKTFFVAELPPLHLPVKEIVETAGGDTALVPVRRYFDLEKTAARKTGKTSAAK